MSNRTKGKVYLVGAGPGDADLITVRGAELLRGAECVIYDKLANPALLKFASEDAEIIHVPKRIGAGSCTQDEINAVLLEKALAGKDVVRLKGGDPCMFGRAAEELRVLADAGVEFEIVPGVTAAIAAGAYTGIMLTDREYSSQVVFVTGREAADKGESDIDWSSLARMSGTIVFYMGMGRLEFIAGELVRNGRDAATPAAVIADATFGSQRVVKGRLGDIAERCRAEKVEPPAIIVIGAAAESDERFNWFMRRPLFGRNIVVTRDRRGNAEFAGKIVRRGGNPVEFATIEIRALTQRRVFLETLSRIRMYDWVVFTSANGVRVFFEALARLNEDGRILGSAKVAAIGPATAAKLGEFGIRADFVPGVFTGRELGLGLTAFTSLRNRKVLLLRSEGASKEAAEMLAQGGAAVEDVAIYSTAPVKGDAAELEREIGAGRIDWVTFGSPSAARSFFGRIPADAVNSSRARVASIGPVTSEELKGLGARVDVEAGEHTLDGLLGAIEGMSEG